MQRDYPNLRILTGFLKVFLYVLTGLGIAGAAIILVEKTPGFGVLTGLGVLFMYALCCAAGYLIFGVIKLLLEINNKLIKLSKTVRQPSKHKIN